MSAITLVVNDTGSLTTGETAIDTHLDTTHTVTVVGKSTSVATVNSSGADAVVVGPGIGFSSVPDWSSLTKPLVCLSRAMWVQLGYSTNQGTSYASSASASHLSPIGDVHPIHLGYPVGLASSDFRVTLFSTAPSAVRHPAGPPAALAPRWCHNPSGTSQQTVIFTLEAASSLLSSKTAIARHAAWGLNADADAGNLNSVGLDVFDAMLEWVINAAPAAPQFLYAGSAMRPVFGPFKGSDF